MRVTRFPKKNSRIKLIEVPQPPISLWYDLTQEMRRFTEPFKAFIPTQKKSPKEGKIAYRPVSRSAVCVCTFLIEANSSACKKSADRDPVLHNSQFVDAQIRADCRVCTSIIFCETICLTAAFSRGTRYKLVPVYNWWRKQEILSGVWVEARHEWMKM